MRIAFLSYQWPGLRMGGIGSYVRQCAAALAMAGHDVHVFTMGDESIALGNVPAGVTFHQSTDPARRVIDGKLSAELAAVINSGGEGVYRLAIAWLLTAECQKQHSLHPFDVVEVADVDATGLPLLLNSQRSVPVIVHLHTCTAIARKINSGENITAREELIEAMEAAQIHLADGICAPTNAVMNSTREVMALPVQPALIPHAYVAKKIEFTPPPVNGPVLFVGRIEWRKGCGVIAEVLNEFLRRNETARFKFIGPDTSSAPGGKSVRAYVLSKLDSDVASRVEFAGELALAEIEQSILESSYCVLPSLSENFSLAICEAMALGRTTIVASGTGSAELVGTSGVIVRPGDAESLLMAMENTYRDRSQLADLSRYAFERVRELCDPLAVSAKRVAFYEAVARQYRETDRNTTGRLRSLPMQVGAALLPCIASITAAMVMPGVDVDSPGHRLEKICRDFSKGHSKPARVLLYGAGKHTERLLSERHVWEQRGHRVVGLIDDHPRFEKLQQYLGLPVTAVTRLRSEELSPGTCVILSTDTYEDQFWERTSTLRSKGLSVFRLYGN